MTSPPGLQPGAYYHIFNRGTNRENLFREERNYPYFLKLYAQYVEPIAETYAYCLLKNHFHLLVQIKDDVAAPAAASQGFANLFSTYAKAINNAYRRTGSLFEHPYGRIEVRDNIYFSRLVVYIHQNPQQHGLVTDFRDWKYSSYHALTTNSATRLKRETVVRWFDDLTNFKAVHDNPGVEPVTEMPAPNDFD
jgi:REP element-mobilizing transposase RayT